MLLVTARHHIIIVFVTQRQWKNVNDTIADWNWKHSTARMVPCCDANERDKNIAPPAPRPPPPPPQPPVKNYKGAHVYYYVPPMGRWLR